MALATTHVNGGVYDVILMRRTPGKDFGRLRCGAAIPEKRRYRLSWQTAVSPCGRSQQISFALELSATVFADLLV
jgi:hypothetical protein